jgi:ribosomal protein S18 acetylase RimI-like enzyme
MTQEPALPRPRYRAALKEDLYEVGRVYLRAFPEGPRSFASPRLTALAVGDVMRAALEADPGSIIVAQAPTGEIVGYVIAVAEAANLLHVALFRGLALRWLWRWLRGFYGLSLAGALLLAQDKLRLRRAASAPEVGECPARIISLAVDPDWQRRGVGTQLLYAGLQRLRGLGRSFVRLEVRPDNLAARRLYRKAGFREAGQFEDTHGPWMVLIAGMGAPETSEP